MMNTVVEPRTLAIIDCRGAARQRGEAHGEQLRAQIEVAIERWSDSLTTRHRISAVDYINEFLGNTNFVPSIERHTPDLLDEVRGIAEGAGQTFETIFAYNLMDEEWQYADERENGQPGCTVACMFPANGAPVIAQTMDIPSVHDGSQAVIRHKPDHGVETVVFTGAGMLALNGANDSGVGVVVNNLSMLPSSRAGLPVIFAIRGILQQRTLDDAVTFVTSVPHAIGQHYAIGATDGFAGLEAAANGVVRVNASDGRYVHANHPVAHTSIVGDPAVRFARSRTFERAERAAELIEDATDSDGVERALMDETVPISREPRGGFMTFGATSITCSVPPVVRITAGPPHQSPWVTVAMPS